MATGRPRFMISVDDHLFNRIEDFRFSKRYPTRSQATEELLRVALDYLKEQAEDEHLLALALEREKSNRPTISQKQMREKLGITQKDIDETEADFD